MSNSLKDKVCLYFQHMLCVCMGNVSKHLEQVCDINFDILSAVSERNKGLSCFSRKGRKCIVWLLIFFTTITTECAHIKMSRAVQSRSLWRKENLSGASNWTDELRKKWNIFSLGIGISSWIWEGRRLLFSSLGSLYLNHVIVWYLFLLTLSECSAANYLQNLHDSK